MVKAVIFDVFGTLLRSVRPNGPYVKLSRQIPSVNFLVKRHEMMTTDRPFEDYLSELPAGTDGWDLLDDLQAELDAITPFEDVAAYIDVLKWRGYRVAVCSNLAQAYGDKVRELLPDVERHFLSYEIGLIKPDPRIYAHVAAELGLEASECLFAGDSEKSDVRGPAIAGMNSMKIDRSWRARPLHEQVDERLMQLDTGVVSVPVGL